MDFGKLFDDASVKVKSAIDDAIKVGVPALQASAEQWGIDTLKQMQKEHQKDLNTAIKDVTAKEPAPGSFGAALSATVKGSILETNGMLIIGVVLGLVLIGFLLRGK